MTAALYTCRITHLRTTPARRLFSYRSYLWLVDLDDLPRVPFPLRPFASFLSRDHLDGTASSLRAGVDAYVSRHGIDLAGGRVVMLAQARVLGHVFNPLTAFWCHGPDGNLAAVIAEVHNTYGERHVYLLHPDDRGRAETDKDFYVSPFLPVAGHYRLRLPEPASTLRLGVTLHLSGRPVLAAAVTGRRRAYTPWRLLACTLRYPWVTGQVSALIRWQGIRLWARRLPIYPKPAHSSKEGAK